MGVKDTEMEKKKKKKAKVKQGFFLNHRKQRNTILI